MTLSFARSRTYLYDVLTEFRMWNDNACRSSAVIPVPALSISEETQDLRRTLMAPSFPRGCPIASSMLPTKVDIPDLPKKVPLVLSVSKSLLNLMYSQKSFETLSLNAKRWGPYRLD